MKEIRKKLFYASSQNNLLTSLKMIKLVGCVLGKKDYVVKGAVKKQRRVLLDTVHNLDGVGGTLKRGADLKVSLGKDITSAVDFVDALENCNINLSHIPSSAISRLKTVTDDLTIQLIQ